MKIRSQLTFMFTGIVGAILLIFSFSILYFYSLFRDIEFHEQLIDKAYKTSELYFELNERNERILDIINKHEITTLYDQEILIFDTTFTNIYRSGSFHLKVSNAVLDDVIKNREIRIRDNHRETVGIVNKINSHKIIVIASAVDVIGYQKRNNLIIILISGWFISVIIIFFSGQYFSANALQPILEVVGQVDKITVSNLNTRVKAGNGQDEIAQLAEKFNKMLERLEEAFTMQKNFVSNASHELRTPLTSITGQIEVVLMKPRTIEEYTNTLQSILEDIKALTKMSNSLLDLAKVSSDESNFKTYKYRIDELLWQTRSELIKQNTKFKVIIDFENFPYEESELVLEGNPNLLKTAFSNLMENACKFSPNHTVDILIIFTKKEVKLLFMDTGIGMSKDDIAHIFQPFYRSVRNKAIGGFGIGLSLVHKIISMHEGRIEVNSTLNTGSIFTINLIK